MGKLNFNPVSNLARVAHYGLYLYGLVVQANSQWKTIQDFIQFAKQNPQKISFGIPGMGTPPRLAMEEPAHTRNPPVPPFTKGIRRFLQVKAIEKTIDLFYGWFFL